MEKVFSILYEGNSYGGKYEIVSENDHIRINVLCPPLSEHIPKGFYFISNGNTFDHHPKPTDKTKEIAALIWEEIKRKETLNFT